MRGLGIMGLAFGLIVSFLFASVGCDEEKDKIYCCTCTCYMVNGSKTERTESLSNITVDCDSGCRVRCEDELGMQSRDPQTQECLEEDSSSD